MHEVERNRVDRVDLIVLVEVGVEGVLHHHELVSRRPRLARIDDEGAVEAFRDVPGQRGSMAVVEVQAERARLELVGEVLADLNQPAADVLADPGRSVHGGRMDAVEVDRVRMRARVDEVNAQQVAFACAQRRAWHTAVIRPGGVLDPGHDLDLLVVRDQLPLAQHAAAGEPARLAPVEIAHHRTRVEAVHGRIDRCLALGKARV